ncbi:uncharacterized protein LOC107414272 [Ziziphus jujuba]|uniref:Uncharacterized protein LOC107414272 n=1 Tax=Ziziphus jujuba TaxID=326968 RepID=A0A6P3ZWG4_ZIZJJ|nr:uncharacterized protein LOC107414272 [Ziziphus jujuba]
MVLKALIVNSNKKQVREPPSVPFLWEEKPGIPKKDWKPGVSSVSSVPIPPVKLIASVPFEWEEKPGTPLPIFSQQPFISVVPPLSKPPPLPAPPMYYQSMHENEDTDGDGDDKEIFGNETEDSFRSAPSLLANGLVSSVAISTDVPAKKISSAEENSGPVETTPSSPASETGSSTSSYATGVSSLVGSSFLECLFPLFPPQSGFLEKVGHPEGSLTPLEQKSRHFEQENNGITVRRPPTLGELIMMSRRRSYRRKAIQMRKQKLTMEIMKSRAFGCCIFGTGSRIVEELHRKRKELARMKLL